MLVHLCYVACDAILMKIIDIGFCGLISARGLGGSAMAEGIRMSCGGLVNVSDRIRVFINKRVYRTVLI